MYSSADLLARTIMAEAGNQPYEGKVAVGASVLNRLNSGRYGETMQDVLWKPYQYEPWGTKRDELLNYDTSSPEYKEASEIAVKLMAGELDDPTGGATHFINPKIVAERRGGSMPDWWPKDQGRVMTIGDHAFTAADDPNWRAQAAAAQDMTTPAYDAAATDEMDYQMAGIDPASGGGGFDMEGLLGSKSMKMAMGLLAEEDKKKRSSGGSAPQAQVYRPQAQPRGTLRGLLG